MKMEKSDIQAILPHKAPMLLIDQAELAEDGALHAKVHIHPDWDIFRGHFPGHPILPAIYITESMAQAADLILLTIPGNEGKLPLFLGISQMRFLRPVVPGDTLELSAKLECDSGDDMYDCAVSASVGGKRVALGKITLALRDG